MSQAFKERRRANKAAIDKLKAKPCTDCHGTFPPCAMDFDHRDGSMKKAELAKLVFGGAAMTTIMREVEKCELVCANCHRVRTWKRNQEAKRIARALNPQGGLFDANYGSSQLTT